MNCGGSPEFVLDVAQLRMKKNRGEGSDPLRILWPRNQAEERWVQENKYSNSNGNKSY